MKLSKRIISAVLSILIVMCSVPGALAVPSSTSVFKKAYIANAGGTIDVVDLTTNAVERAKINVGGFPVCAAMNPNGTQVLIAQHSANTVAVVDPASDTVTATITVGSGPAGIAYNTDGSKAYVANYQGNSISIINTATLTVTGTVSVPTWPAGVIVVGNNLYVACQTGGKVVAIDTQTDTISAEITVNTPFGITANPAHTKIYVANIYGNSISVIDCSQNTLEATIPVGLMPYSVEVSPDGSKAYVANYSSNSISVVNTSSNTVISSVTVGTGPAAVGVSVDGSKVYAINRVSSDMSIINTSTNTVEQTIGLSNGPFILGTFMIPASVAATIPELASSPPSALSSTKYGHYNTPVTFSVSDFVYNDTIGNHLDKIMFTSLPANGTLKVGSVAASVYEEVHALDIGRISFIPDTRWSGSTFFSWNVNTGGGYGNADAIMTIDIPCGNNNLTGLALGSATLTPAFDSSVTSYSAIVPNATSSTTVTASVYDSVYGSNAGISINGNPAVSGIASGPISLNEGLNTIAIEVTAQDNTKKVYTVTINRAALSTPTPTPTPVPASSSSSSSSTTVPQISNTGADILVNGKTENAGTVSTSTTTDGKNVTTISIDPQKLAAKLNSEGNNAIVTIPVNTKSDIVIGELTGEMIKGMENKQATLEIKTDAASYKLPAGEIQISDISSQLGTNIELKDIKVQVEISKPSNDIIKAVEESAKKGSFEILAVPVEFKVTCTYGSATIPVSKFNSYVERTIAIPDGIDPGRITTGIVAESDGTVRHVPTKVERINGKYNAVIKSLTNSTYSVVWHPLEFTDVLSHWAKTEVNDMGSRMVISGVGNDTFEPDRDITRAEFSAIIVRALGLKPGIGSNPFIDVTASDWYSDFIKTAYDYKIITGYSTNKFGPMEKITRQQAMVMISRAMKITGLKSGLTTKESDQLLKSFTDADTSADYAKTGIAECVKAGIVSGRNGTLAPADNITRAEVAAIARRLLQKSSLI